MAKADTPVPSPTPKPTPGLKPLTPAARGLAAPTPTKPADPRGAEPRQQEFEDDFAYAIAYKMWKDGAPFDEWSKYRKGGEKAKPASLMGVVKGLPGAARDFPQASLKIIPQAAVGIAMLGKGFVTPSKSTEGQPGWQRALNVLGGQNEAVEMTIESFKATPQTLVQGVRKLEEGKAPVAEFSEVAGNVGIVTGIGSALARGRLVGLGEKAASARAATSAARESAWIVNQDGTVTPSAGAAKANAKADRLASKASKFAAKEAQFAPVAENIRGFSRAVNKIADAPITLPAKAVGKSWKYWVDTRRTKANKLRADANFEAANLGGETVTARNLRNKANRMDARWGKIVMDEQGQPLLGPDGKPIVTANATLQRMLNRFRQAWARNESTIVQGMKDLKENPDFGPLTDIEEQALFAVANGRAQLIAEIANRTGEAPSDIAFKMRPVKSEEGRYLSREGAELAVALVNGDLDPATTQRLSAATQRLKELMEQTTRYKRKGSIYKEGAGYGRAKPLDPAMEVPTPKPEWLIEALEKEGSGQAMALAEEIRERFQDPDTGEFVYDPQASETMLFIMDIMQDVPDSVAFDPKVYPGKERSNVVAYLSYLRANEALAGMTVRGAPPGPDTTTRTVRPLSENPETGLPPEAIYGDALEPGTLSRTPRKYIAGAVRELERLRGRARKLGERITDLQLKIQDYERKIIKSNLELDALNGWYEDGNGNVVRLQPGEAVPPGLEFRPGLIQRARIKVTALRAAVQKMNDEQADTTTLGDTTVTRAEAETKLAVAEQQLADFEAAAVNAENRIAELDDSIDGLEEASTALENEMIDEGADPDPLLDALDKDLVGLPDDPLSAASVRTVAIPASVIAETPWIQTEYQGTLVQRNGVGYYEFDLSPDDLFRIQKQLEGQVSYYSQKPQTGDTPQRLTNLRSGLRAVNDNLPKPADAYQPSTIFEAIAPETARERQVQLDADHRDAYDQFSTLAAEADQLADIAAAENVIYPLVRDINAEGDVKNIGEIVPQQAVQQAVYGEWSDAYDFLDMTVGLAEGKPASRLLVGLIESSKRRDARGRVRTDKFGNPIPTSFEVLERLGSMERLRRRKSPYVGFGRSARDIGESGNAQSSKGLKFTSIDQAMDRINRDGRFGQFDDYTQFMEKFVEMVDVYDSLNSFVTKGRLPRQIYSNKVRDFPLQLQQTQAMTFDEYVQARRDPEVLADVVRAESRNLFNQAYSDISDPIRREQLFPELAGIDTEVLQAMMYRADEGQPPVATTRLQELDAQIAAVQERIAAIGEELGAVEEALALEPDVPEPRLTSPETEAALARAAETGQLTPVGRFAEGGPSALREVDWVKETKGQFSIDTGTRKFRINKVGKVWVLKRIAGDGKVADASAQEFSSFPAARRYVQEGIEFDKNLPTLRPVYRPGFELGPGDQALRLTGPDSELVRAERTLAQRERKAAQTTRLIEQRTGRLEKMRIEEARLRAILPAVTEAAVRLEARLGQEIVTQPDVTVAGRLGQPTGRVFVGQPTGAPAVARPVSVDGVPVEPGSPVGAMLRPEVETVRRGRQSVGDAGEIAYSVTQSERAANRALLARTRNLPPTLPMEVSYAIGEMEGAAYVGSTYFPAVYKPSAAPGARRGFEEGLVGEIVLDTEKLKSGQGMDIWSIQELVKVLVREQRGMDLNEAFRMLISSKFAVTPRMILGDAAVEAILREAEQLALLDPDLNPQYPGAVAAYPLGNPNRELIFENARNKIVGEKVDAKMRELGYETLPTTGDIGGSVPFEEINGDRPYLPAYTREKVQARYPSMDARPLPTAVNTYLKAVTATTTAFKQTVLPFSVRWQLGDVIGFFIAAGVSGENIGAFAGEFKKALKDNYATFREVFADPTNERFFKYERTVTPRGRLQGQSGLQQIGLRGEETAFLQGRQLGTESKGIIASTPVLGRIVDLYQRTIVKGAFKINEALNTGGRQALSNMKLQRILDERGLTLDDIPDGGAEALDPAVREALYDAADIANEFMGDYMDMTPAEKKWVLPHITFYAWIKHVHKLFAKLAVSNPAAIRWHLYLGALAFEEEADPTGLVSGSMLVPGWGYVDLNWASTFADVAQGPVGSLVQAASAGRPVYPENPLRPALGALSPLPRIIGAAGGLNIAQVRGIERPPGTGMVTSTGKEIPTPLILRPAELASFAAQQFPVINRVLDVLPQGEIPGLGLATGPVRRYDTGQTRLKYRTTKPDVKGTGRFGWRGAASRLLTLPFMPELSEEEKQRFERSAKARLLQFETAKRRAEALRD